MKRVLFVMFALVASLLVMAGQLSSLATPVTQLGVLKADADGDKPVLPAPVINVVEEDERVIISAEGEGTVTLYVNGNAVSNPYPRYRSYEEIFLTIEAVAEREGWQSGYATMDYVVIPIPIPFLEITWPPSVSGQSVDKGYQITLYESEPSTIYYRYGVLDEANSEWILGDFLEYTEPLLFSAPGRYRVDAFATVPGKLDSEWITYEFTVGPLPIYDFEEDGIFYKIADDGKVSVCSETTSYNSYSGHVTIPATVTHEGMTYMVTAIKEYAFSECAGLTGVTIGAYVTAIGTCAFSGCTSLTSVTLGDYVITVGYSAFGGCSNLESVTLGSGVARISDMAFDGCNALTSVTCKSATPPEMVSSRCFNCYDTATLHVYPAVFDNYRAADNWNQFANIVAEDNVSPSVGDLNGDGVLTVSDVTSLIRRILSGQ